MDSQFKSMLLTEAIVLRQKNVVKNLKATDLDKVVFESNDNGSWLVTKDNITKTYNHYDLMIEYCVEGSFHKTQMSDLIKLLSDNDISHKIESNKITTNTHIYTMSDYDDIDYDTWYVTPLNTNKESYGNISHFELLTNSKYFIY